MKREVARPEAVTEGFSFDGETPSHRLAAATASLPPLAFGHLPLTGGVGPFQGGLDGRPHVADPTKRGLPCRRGGLWPPMGQAPLKRADSPCQREMAEGQRG